LWLDIKCDGITGGVLEESNSIELPSMKKHHDDTNFQRNTSSRMAEQKGNNLI
jgi:hypothetical protein